MFHLPKRMQIIVVLGLVLMGGAAYFRFSLEPDRIEPWSRQSVDTSGYFQVFQNIEPWLDLSRRSKTMLPPTNKLFLEVSPRSSKTWRQATLWTC